MNDREEASVVASLIAAAIMRRFAKALREEGATDEEAIDTLAMLAGVTAIPVLETFLIEEDVLGALDEIDTLEGMLSE